MLIVHCSIGLDERALARRTDHEGSPTMTTQHEPLSHDSSSPKEPLAEAKGSAKAAEEKVASRGARMVEFSKDNVEALKASGRIAANGAKALGQEAVDNVKREYAAFSDGPKNLSGVKSCLESARD